MALVVVLLTALVLTASAHEATAATESSLSATFDGGDGVFAGAHAFWTLSDRGLSQNADWFAEGGTMYRRSSTGFANASTFRMWTRRKDLAFTTTEMDVRFNGWTGGTAGWHGINLWLNHKLRTPSDGSAVADGWRQEGYSVDFMNRDGKLYIQKKVGNRYHLLAQREWRPRRGTWYRWGGRVIDNGNGTNTIEVLLNGQVIQAVTDNGSVGGARLVGGRVGVRADYANFNVDNLAISRPSASRVEAQPDQSETMPSGTFDAADGTVVSSGAFWDSSDLGVSQNPNWFAEAGTMYRRSGMGWTNSDTFRLWTRRSDLAFTETQMDIRFNGWTGGTAGWDGIDLWLNRRLQTPGPGGQVDDGATQGYVVNFVNRDGNVYIQKKVGAVDYTLAQREWSPTPGTWYRWGGRVIDNGNGTSTIQVLLDGQVVQEVTDDASAGGARLGGGRVGLASDNADLNVDDLAVSRG